MSPKTCFLSVLVLCAGVHAQGTTPALASCAFWKSPLPIMVADLSYGQGFAWWCELSDGRWMAQMQRVHNADRDPAKWAAATARVATAANPEQQLALELQAAYVPAAAGSQKEYENNMLLWSACEKARVSPPASAVPPPADWCGPKPVAVVQSYIVAPAAANAVPAGTRPTYKLTLPSTIAVDGGRVNQGTACDCTLAKVSVGTSSYCSVQGSASKVAICVKTP